MLQMGAGWGLPLFGGWTPGACDVYLLLSSRCAAGPAALNCHLVSSVSTQDGLAFPLVWDNLCDFPESVPTAGEPTAYLGAPRVTERRQILIQGGERALRPKTFLRGRCSAKDSATPPTKNSPLSATAQRRRRH